MRARGLHLVRRDMYEPERDLVAVSRRPWGQYDQLTVNERTTVKIITVEAGRQLSRQRHDRRDELWFVLDGPVVVNLDGVERTLEQRDLVWVPRRVAHQMTAPAEGTGARVLEIAFGEYLEDDVTRLADDDGRA